jgi:hypothetical protein
MTAHDLTEKEREMIASLLSFMDQHENILANLRCTEAEWQEMCAKFGDKITAKSAGVPANAHKPSPVKMLASVRELVSAGEEAGWDLTVNQHILDNGREAYQSLRRHFGIDLPGDEPLPKE